MKNGNADFAAVQDVPGVQPEVSRLLELRAKRNDLLRSYTLAHPAVREIDDTLRQVEEKIAGAARLAVQGLDQQLGDLNRALGQNSERLQQMPTQELELVRLTRSNKVNAELYSYLLQRQQETRIRQASTSSSVEIIDRAQLPQSPVKPNTRKNLALGLVLGAMLGIGLTFLLDYLDRTIKDEDDVQEKLGLPVLGTIPKIDKAADGSAGRLITSLEPLSPACEAFLALRTNLLYIVTSLKHKTILVTSCLPDEGKSTVAANLAVTLAQTGAQTLLVDCDLRRPSLHRIFDQSEHPGLSDLLVDTEHTASSVRHLKALNLDFIPDGTEPPNPTQLLNSDQARAFLASARKRYDYIVLDVPPLLPVADALILASQVDLNVLVVGSCRVPERLAQRALKSLPATAPPRRGRCSTTTPARARATTGPTALTKGSAPGVLPAQRVRAAGPGLAAGRGEGVAVLSRWLASGERPCRFFDPPEACKVSRRGMPLPTGCASSGSTARPCCWLPSSIAC